MKTARHRPTIGAAVAILLSELVQWGTEALPASVPPRVRDALLGFGWALVAAVVGYIVQSVGKRAPWAADTHAAAVAYATTLDPEDWREHVENLGEKLGIGSLEEAEHRLGLRE